MQNAAIFSTPDGMGQALAIDNALVSQDIMSQNIFLQVVQESIFATMLRPALKDYNAILIILTPSMSKMVKDELDFSLIQSMKGKTRLLFPCLVTEHNPPALMHRPGVLDFVNAFENSVEIMVKEIKQGQRRPREYAQVCGLSPHASEVGLCMVYDRDDYMRYEKNYDFEASRKIFDDFTDEQYREAIVTLSKFGLVNYPNTQWQDAAEPSYALYLHFMKYLDYEPYEDIERLAQTLLRHSEPVKVTALEREIGVGKILQYTPMPKGRMHRALHYLDDYSLISVERQCPKPSHETMVKATERTKKFVEENTVAKFRERNSQCPTS